MFKKRFSILKLRQIKDIGRKISKGTTKKKKDRKREKKTENSTIKHLSTISVPVYHVWKSRGAPCFPLPTPMAAMSKSM